MQKVLNVMVDRRDAVEQDPRHCSAIITLQLLTPERCLAQPGEMGPQNQVTGNGVYQELCELNALALESPSNLSHHFSGSNSVERI